MYRTSDFDKHLSKQLKRAKYRREYLLSVVSEMDGEPGLTIFEALKHTISKMGVTEFANMVNMKRSSISRILSQESAPKLETLDKLLAPFGLEVKVDVREIA